MGVIEETKKKKGNCVCTAACGAGLGHNIEEVEIECVTCGTYGKVKNYGGRDKNIFNEICPNCSSGEFKRRK
jgi:Zn finger protein HypA/HybF involved in hydrogenase expression